jgi:hypothetical protein
MSDGLAALLGERLGALASEAERLGAPPDAVERLLAAASVAAMRALALSIVGDAERDDATAEAARRPLRDAA